jgi:hypothetical protein
LAVETAASFTFVMTSPGWIPAADAGVEGCTVATVMPLGVSERVTPM